MTGSVCAQITQLRDLVNDLQTSGCATAAVRPTTAVGRVVGHSWTPSPDFR